MTSTRLLSIEPRSVAGKLVRLPLRLLPKGMVLPVLSGINRGFRWRVGSHIHGAWIGIYEKDKQQVCLRLIHPGMTVYDIGAQAGFYSLAFSRLVSTGHVYSFEPFSENCTSLLDHLRLNNIQNVIVHQVAISDRSGLVDFRIGISNAMGSIINEPSIYRVYTVTIDELVEKNGLPPPDLVKMDVEGSEASVLRGAVRVLQARRSVWMVALHGRQPAQECWDIFEQHAYSIFDMDGKRVRSASETPDEIYAIADKTESR